MSEIRPDTLLLYGDTGTGKTGQIGELAEWEYAKTGRITRLISADSGWDPIEHLIITSTNPPKWEGGEGIIQAVNIQFLQNPFPVLIKLSEGYWPKVVGDHFVMVETPPEWMDRIGQYANEGLTTFSNLTMRDHIRNQTKLKDVSGNLFTRKVDVTDSKGVTKSEDMSFGLADRSHFMQVQDFILLDLVPRFSRLPVARVLWTAHEAKGDDDVSGMKNTVLGPATIGKAAVNKTAMKFGDTLHFTKVLSQKRANGKLVTGPDGKPLQQVEYRAYFEDHPDDVLTSMVWKAKLSLPLSRIRALREEFPFGYVPLELEGGMGKYFDFRYRTPEN